MLFSVIVPIYNIEKYIRRCIDSVLEQSFTDYELILVDDGSPDGCGAICDEYAAKDTRIKVIHKQNGGLVSARQAGIKVASGDYIFNLDGDDSLLPNALESASISSIVSRYFFIFQTPPRYPSSKRTHGLREQASRYREYRSSRYRCACF